MIESKYRDRQLIYISGAVASGKTTLAAGLARLGRERGLPAASIDLDALVEMVAGRDWSLVTHAHRELSWRLTATIVQRLLHEGVTLIAIAGSTLSPAELKQALGHLKSEVPTTRVLLRVSIREAIRRARGDPTRATTRDPNVVTRLHQAIDWAHVETPDIEVATDGMSPDEVARAVWRRVFG